VFLLGVLTRRANQRGAMIGMACGLCMELYLWRWTQVPWTWWVMIGTVVTFCVGWAGSAIFGSNDRVDVTAENAGGC
jgi:Na+/proline symporter